MGDKLDTFDKDTSFRILELVNSWIIAADNKSSILIAFIALLVGLSAGMFNQIVDSLVNGDSIIVLFVILFGILYITILGLVIYHLIEVFIARIKIKEKNSEVNLLSFISIANFSSKEYIDEANQVNEGELRDMLLSQINVNSKIAKRKMKHFNLALIFSVILIPVTIILMIIIG